MVYQLLDITGNFLRTKWSNLWILFFLFTNLADRDCWQFQVVEILFDSYLHLVSKVHWLEQKQTEILKVDILFLCN